MRTETKHDVEVPGGTPATARETRALPGKLGKLAAEANARHRDCIAATKSACEKVLEFGRWLASQRERLGHGTFGDWVETLEFSRRTAERYMQVAAEYDAKRHLLPEGAGLIDLYRAFGLVKEREGGAHRATLDRGYAQQMELCFGVMTKQLQVVGGWGVERLRQLEREQLVATRDELRKTLGLVEEALAESPKSKG